MSALGGGWHGGLPQPENAHMHTQLIQNGRPPTIAAPVVTAAGVVRRYGEGDTAVDALRGVSVDLPAGQCAAVMGPPGAGKSTLIDIRGGLDKPTAGEVPVACLGVGALDDTEL